MDAIFDAISFGVGPQERRARRPSRPRRRSATRTSRPSAGCSSMAAQQLGTVGSGNHYVDLFEGDDGYVWVGVHFGSRGFGHRTASGFLALAQGKAFGDHATEGEMDSPPILFDVDSELGQSYIAAMHLAGDYAYAGRERSSRRCSTSSAPRPPTRSTTTTTSPGARTTPASTCGWSARAARRRSPASEGFVGATMGEPSVILRGVESEASRDAAVQTVHGAGRVMSRTEAAGKSRKRWACPRRGCDWVQGAGRAPAGAGGAARSAATTGWSKRMVQLTPGVINWPRVQASHQRSGHRAARRRRRRGARRLQAPGRRARRPRRHDRGPATLRPIGVAMAGAGTFDPYKD